MARHTTTSMNSAEGEDLTATISDFLEMNGAAAGDGKALWRSLSPRMPAILESFYGALTERPELAQKLGVNCSRVEELKATQQRHMDFLLNHGPGPELEEQARKIGEAHVRAEITPLWYLAAYGRLFHDMIPALVAGSRLSPRKQTRMLQTAVSHIFLDMVLAYDAYQRSLMAETVGKKEREKDVHSLRKLAQSVANINDVTLSMAYLSNNIRAASDGGQAISSASAELVASIQQIAATSDGIAREADATNTAIADGLKSMQAVSTTIKDIAASSQRSADDLTELHEASDQISAFLTVIESIAAQTNLLALNATIEAARAGEAGKGFAVVAAEVKDLATQTAKATEDIAQRIEALKGGMMTIRESIESSQNAVEKGEEKIAGANSLMETVGTQIGDVSHKMQEISSILQQQHGASQEIAESITRVADLANENERRLSEMSGSLDHANGAFLEDAKVWFDADSIRSLCEMAKIDHVMFKKRIVDTVTGRDQCRAGEVPDHHACRLGKWYDAITDERIRAHPSFVAMREPHKTVHGAARETLEAYGRGDKAAVGAGLDRLEAASIEVIDALDAFSAALDGDLKKAG